MLDLARRELVPALGAHRVGGVDQRIALGALLGGGVGGGTRGVLGVRQTDRVHRAVPKHVAAEVQHEALGLPLGQAESPPDHLVVEPGAHRRAQHRHAVDIRGVEARRQHIDICQVLQVARLEAGDQRIAILGRCSALNEPALLAVLLSQHPHHMLAVPDARAEQQHAAPVGSRGDDLGARRLDQCVLVHALLELAGDELAAPHMDVAGVRDRLSGPALERTQVALHDELPHAGLEAHLVQHRFRAADRAGLHPIRRRRQPDDALVVAQIPRIGQEAPVHALAIGRDQMRFVDDDQIKRPKIVRPLVDRLDARDRHGVPEIPPTEPGAEHAHRQVRRNGLQLARRLLDQLLHAGDHDHPPVPLLHRVAAQLGDDVGLARAGRKHDGWVRIAGGDVVPHRIDRIALVGPELAHWNTPGPGGVTM